MTKRDELIELAERVGCEDCYGMGSRRGWAGVRYACETCNPQPFRALANQEPVK